MSFSGQGTDTRGDGESEAHIERRDQGSLEWANGTAAATRGPFDYAGQDTDSSVEDEGDEDEDKHVPFPGRFLYGQLTRMSATDAHVRCLDSLCQH